MQSIEFWDVFQLFCLTLFVAIKGGRTVSLIVRYKVNPITLRVKKRGLQGLVELALFVNVNLWAAAVVIHAVVPGLLSRLGWLGYPVWSTHVTRYVGLILIGLAFAILIPGQLALGTAWRLGIDEKHPGELVTHGIYAMTRNPIYLFFDLYFVGTFLLNSTWFFALSAAFTVLNLHYQILNEEQYLDQIYGAAYQTYRVCTGRYWNGLRAWRVRQEGQQAETG